MTPSIPVQLVPAKSIPVSREAVIWAFRLFWGREIESEDTIQAHMRLNNLDEVVRVLICSKEFAQKGRFSNLLQFTNASELSGADKLIAANAPDLVNAAYLGLLGRQADPAGLDRYASKLARTPDFSEMLSDITRSEEFWRKIRALHANLRLASVFTVEDLDEEKLVFLHHPKTGGTTLRHLLVKNFPEDKVCPERFNGLRFLAAGELAHYRLFSGHFDLPSIRLIPGRKKIITMLREPVARLISLYYFLRAHRPQVIDNDGLELARLANKHAMAEFFQADEVRSHPTINNSLTRVLTGVIDSYRWEGIRPTTPLNPVVLSDAARELESLDGFGILDRYEDSIELMFKSLGMPLPTVIEPRQVLDVIVNEEAGLRRIQRERVTPEIRNIISSLVRIDIKLYRHACAIFESRLTQLRQKSHPNLIHAVESRGEGPSL